MVKEVTLPISEFKAKCLRLLGEISGNGQTLVITKRGRPIAKVIPMAAPPKRLGGTWEGLVKGDEDIVYFSTAGDWELNK